PVMYVAFEIDSYTVAQMTDRWADCFPETRFRSNQATALRPFPRSLFLERFRGLFGECALGIQLEGVLDGVASVRFVGLFFVGFRQPDPGFVLVGIQGE